MDFSDIPAVFGGVLFGPAYGVLIELIKNLLEMLLKGFRHPDGLRQSAEFPGGLRLHAALHHPYG